MDGKDRDETDCPVCNYPRAKKPSKESTKKTDSKEPLKVSFRSEQFFDIAGVGRIPLKRGHIDILPRRAKAFISEQAAIMRPSEIYICNGSVFEDEFLKEILVRDGRLERLRAYPDVHLARSHETDTGGIDSATFVLTDNEKKVDASGTCVGACEQSTLLSYVTPLAVQELFSNFVGCMRNRTMFVIPFSLGPIGGRYSINAVQITDCPFVVLVTRILARVCSSVWDAIGKDGSFVECVHSVGVPRPVFSEDMFLWPCVRASSFMVQDPKGGKVFCFGTAYWGASALCRRPVAVCIGQHKLRKHGLFAEYGSLIAITDPKGTEIFVVVQGPYGSGKRQFTFLEPRLPGWKVRAVSDNAVWLRWGDDGKLYAMNPMNGAFGNAYNNFGDAQGAEYTAASMQSLLLNVGSTNKGEFVCQRSVENVEGSIRDWRGKWWKQGDKQKIAHENSRYVASYHHIPCMHPGWDSATGHPVSAFIFTTNRIDLVPVVMQSYNWLEGLTLAACVRTIKSRLFVADNALTHNPFGMAFSITRGFSSYLNDWSTMESKDRKMPRTFHANLFRQGAYGKKLFPGGCEVIRLLEWVHGRVTNAADDNMIQTPVGFVPKHINNEFLETPLNLEALTSYDEKGWMSELEAAADFFAQEKVQVDKVKIAKVLEDMTQYVKNAAAARSGP